MDWIFAAAPVAPLTLVNRLPAIATPMEEVTNKGKEITISKLEVSVFPNPAESYFNLKVQGKSMELITIKVIDIAGRRVEQKELIPGQTLRFGDKLVNGTYFVEVSQGPEKVVTKVQKQ